MSFTLLLKTWYLVDTIFDSNSFCALIHGYLIPPVVQVRYRSKQLVSQRSAMGNEPIYTPKNGAILVPFSTVLTGSSKLLCSNFNVFIQFAYLLPESELEYIPWICTLYTAMFSSKYFILPNVALNICSGKSPTGHFSNQSGRPLYKFFVKTTEACGCSFLLPNPLCRWFLLAPG